MHDNTAVHQTVRIHYNGHWKLP